MKITLAVTSAALLSLTTASVLVERTPPQNPSCTDFTPYNYKGCYADAGDPIPALVYRAINLDSQNTTIDQCVAFCKGNNWKYAGLEYYGICFCGSSVSGQLVDDSKCNTPCNANKTQACGGNSFVSIYQDPTFRAIEDTSIADYKPLGCYSEGPNGRTLNWQQNDIDTANLDVDMCLSACRDDGYPFAGVEFGKECYCGVVLANGTLPLPALSCNFPCAGDPTQTCGGAGALNLYFADDLESSQPCKDGQSGSSTTTTTTTTSTTSTTTSTTSTTTTTTATITTTTPSVSLCTSYTTTTPTPACEYKCGKWCSKPLPPFSGRDDCKVASSNCLIQLSSCFLQAGWPDSLNCLKYKDWCSNVSSYCGLSCPGSKCSPSGCKSKYPPQNPSNPPTPVTSSTVYPCTASPTTTKTTTTTSSTVVPVPTPSCVCQQPNNPGKGYTRDTSVGSIDLPCLTCNNVYSDYKSGNFFKVYNDPDTSKCPSYGKNSVKDGCKKACDNQYTACVNVFAESCKRVSKRTGSNSQTRGYYGPKYDSAMDSCQSQWKDCYAVNSNQISGNRCTSWNSGW